MPLVIRGNNDLECMKFVLNCMFRYSWIHWQRTCDTWKRLQLQCNNAAMLDKQYKYVFFISVQTANLPFSHQHTSYVPTESRKLNEQPCYYLTFLGLSISRSFFFLLIFKEVKSLNLFKVIAQYTDKEHARLFLVCVHDLLTFVAHRCHCCYHRMGDALTSIRFIFAMSIAMRRYVCLQKSLYF